MPILETNQQTGQKMRQKTDHDSENASPSESVLVRLAKTDEEIKAAQALRYKVFYEEYSATPSPEMKMLKRDFDDFDSYCDHLIVIDEEKQDHVVGTYRLLRQEIAEKHGPFYTSHEYDISALLTCGTSLLELGRSCVLKPYRTRPVLQKLWEGIAAYVSDHNVGLMFGCASFHETDIDKLSEQLSYLYHYHLSPESLRPRTLERFYIDMNIVPKDKLDPRRVFASLPPLIKGYLRLGASIGDGAYLDENFQTTDVCIVMPTHLVTEKYKKHYERKMQKKMTEDQDFIVSIEAEPGT